jgi:hypothetical protein
MGIQKFAFAYIILAACAIDLRGSELNPCALPIIDIQREQGGIVGWVAASGELLEALEG